MSKILSCLFLEISRIDRVCSSQITFQKRKRWKIASFKEKSPQEQKNDGIQLKQAWMIIQSIQIQGSFINGKTIETQAQQIIPQDINIEDVLKGMTLVQGALEYMVLNSQGIPIKKSPTITPEKALHLAFLITDYWSTTKKVIQSDLKMNDNMIQKIRIRTTKQRQIIILQSFNGQATLYLVQNCERKKQEIPEQKKEEKKQ